MRTLRVFESISVDGYYTDADGGMQWAHRGDDAEFNAWVGDNASRGARGGLVMGRVTYDMMAAWWPTAAAKQAMPTVASGMTAATKYVASRDAGFAPGWANAVRLDGDAVDAVRALKAGAGPDLVVLGSGSLAAQLGAAGLVDSYQFVIVPVALGGGRTVFTRGAALRLVEHRGFRNGNVVVTYAPA